MTPSSSSSSERDLHVSCISSKSSEINYDKNANTISDSLSRLNQLAATFLLSCSSLHPQSSSSESQDPSNSLVNESSSSTKLLPLVSSKKHSTDTRSIDVLKKEIDHETRVAFDSLIASARMESSIVPDGTDLNTSQLESSEGLWNMTEVCRSKRSRQSIENNNQDVRMNGESNEDQGEPPTSKHAGISIDGNHPVLSRIPDEHDNSKSTCQSNIKASCNDERIDQTVFSDNEENDDEESSENHEENDDDPDYPPPTFRKSRGSSKGHQSNNVATGPGSLATSSVGLRISRKNRLVSDPLICSSNNNHHRSCLDTIMQSDSNKKSNEPREQI